MNAYYLSNIYMKLCIISKTEQMVYLASCPVKTRWHFNLVFAFWHDGLTLSKLVFLSTWHEFCSLVWYVSDHLFIFYQICLLGLPYLFYEYKGVGLWLWARGELNWTHWYIVLFTSPWFTLYCNFFLLNLFHCRLVETVDPNWPSVQYAVNPSQVDKGCTSSDCSHRIENVRLNLAPTPKMHRFRAHQWHHIAYATD